MGQGRRNHLERCSRGGVSSGWHDAEPGKGGVDAPLCPRFRVHERQGSEGYPIQRDRSSASPGSLSVLLIACFIQTRLTRSGTVSLFPKVIYLLLAFVLHRVSGIGARDAPNAFGIKQLENGRLAGSWVDCDTGVTHTTACFAAGFTLMYDVLGALPRFAAC